MTTAEIIGCIDLTSLEATDTEKRTASIASAVNMLAGEHGLSPAAICVFPPLVQSVRNTLIVSGISVASVCGGFPSGQTSIAVKCEEARYAISEGADEIDLVICRGKFLAGDHAFTHDEIAAVKSVCGDRLLKVILETGDLRTSENISIATNIAIAAGADFIKTATGKSPVGATPEAAAAICNAIKNNSRQVGIKISGGIATREIAEQYIGIAREILGPSVLRPSLFRLGASRLIHVLLAEKGIGDIHF